MNENKVKSGKEIVDDFFKSIASIEGVDPAIAQRLADLYAHGKLTDKNVANELHSMRQHDDDEN